MISKSRLSCAALIVVAGAAGCASSSQKVGDEDMETLRRSVKSYNEAYRWKNFERAASFLPADVRMSFIGAYEEDAKSLNVESYQILQVQVLDERAVDVDVRVTYTLLPSFVVQNRRLKQHWHKVGGRWLLETEDNSIRSLKPAARSRNPDAFGGYDPAPEPPNGGGVEATDRDGRDIRDDRTRRPPARGAPPPSP